MRKHRIYLGISGLFFHPYLGRIYTYSNDKLCASFIGASMKQQKRILSVLFEGIAYSLRDCKRLGCNGIKTDAEHLLPIGVAVQIVGHDSG